MKELIRIHVRSPIRPRDQHVSILRRQSLGCPRNLKRDPHCSVIGPRPVTQARLRHLLSTSEQRGHSLSNSMKSLEQKELIVVSAQQLEIQQQLLLHFLHLKLESMIALPAPNSNTHTPILALMEHPRPVCLYPAPHIGSEDEHLHETRDIMLITSALVAYCVIDLLLANLTVSTHHV